MGLPTGPCGHSRTSEGTQAARRARKVRPDLLLRGLQGGQSQPGSLASPRRGDLRQKRKESGSLGYQPDGSLQGGALSPQGLNKNGEGKMYSPYKT